MLTQIGAWTIHHKFRLEGALGTGKRGHGKETPKVGTYLDKEWQAAHRGRPAEGIVVEIVGGPMDGDRRRVRKPTLTIGRGEDNDVVLLLDPSVSTQHARIVVDQGQFWIEDLGSTNGTYLGEARISGKSSIVPGSVFVVGRTTLELLPS